MYGRKQSIIYGPMQARRVDRIIFDVTTSYGDRWASCFWEATGVDTIIVPDITRRTFFLQDLHRARKYLHGN